MNITKKIDTILLAITVLILTFWCSSFIFLLLNDFSITAAINRWTSTLIWDGIINQWPHTWQAIGISFSISTCLTSLTLIKNLNHPKHHGDVIFAPLTAVRKIRVLIKDKNSLINKGSNNKILCSFYDALFLKTFDIALNIK